MNYKRLKILREFLGTAAAASVLFWLFEHPQYLDFLDKMWDHADTLIVGLVAAGGVSGLKKRWEEKLSMLDEYHQRGQEY